jgi:TonB family protein
MLSVNEEKRLFKIFLYASVASLTLHTGIFIFLTQLGKTWGWIPMDESSFEVSIISMIEKKTGNDSVNHPSEHNANAALKKTAQKTIKTSKPEPDARPEKIPETDSPAQAVNHFPGDIARTETELPMVSNMSVPAGGAASETGIENLGIGGGESRKSGMGDGLGNFGSKMNYLNMVRVKIENQKKYPDAAQQRNIEGQVTVEFEISLDGQISEPSVSKSSGHQSLDLAAIDAVKKASPFASPPRQFFTDAIHINLPIRFELVR